MNGAATPIQYLDEAMNGLRVPGLVPQDAKTQEERMIALRNQISALDEGRVAAIALTLSRSSPFNEVVRQQAQAMDVGERSGEIANAFNNIRDAAKFMVDQIQDGRIDTFDRLGNVRRKVSRAGITTHFDKVKGSYVDVTAATNDQIQREQKILEADQDFRGAPSSPRSWPWSSSRPPRGGSKRKCCPFRYRLRARGDSTPPPDQRS